MNHFKLWFGCFSSLAILLLISITIWISSTSRVSANEIPSPDPSTDFKSDIGVIRGFVQSLDNKRLRTYYKVPYAQPPTGNLRFRPPKPQTDSWAKPLEATGLSAGCPQPDRFVSFQQFAGTGHIKYSEDCLYLNIWAPEIDASHAPLPVLVFIHGGALLFNSASELKYFDAKGLAIATQSIVVSINYRLGVLGFLYGDCDQYPGNLGLLDQLAALSWVRRNVHALGGDDRRITLFGESAGAWSVGLHMLSNMSRGAFDVAVMMSGAPIDPLVAEPAQDSWAKTVRLAAHLNCSNSAIDPSKTIECLQTADLRDLLNSQLLAALQDSASSNAYRLAFQPTYGGAATFLPASPRALLTDPNQGSRHVPLMIGTLTNEGQDTWALYRQSYPDNRIADPRSRVQFENATRTYLRTVLSDLDPSSIDEIIHYYFSTINFRSPDRPITFGNRSPTNTLMRNRNSSKDISIDFNAENVMYQLMSDLVFTCPSRWFARHWYTKENPRVFMYTITYESTSVGSRQFTPWCDQTRHGPCHMIDLQYVFARPFTDSNLYSASDREMSALFISELMSMADFDTATWPSYGLMQTRRSTVVTPIQAQLNPVTGSKLIYDYRSSECELWDQFVFDSL